MPRLYDFLALIAEALLSPSLVLEGEPSVNP